MIGPRHMRTDTLQHRSSTKLLISRFESINPSPASHPSQAAAAPVAQGQPLGFRKKISSPMVRERSKDKTPLRQSFRNLLSVFKKGHGTVRTKSDESDQLVSLACQPQCKWPQVPSPSPADDPCVPNPLFPPARPLSGHSGPLLYLSHLPDSTSVSPIFPVWTTCTATLQGDYILITWLTTKGNPSVHVIPLTYCTDVRSLTLSQIDPDEEALLPRKGDTEDIKVFEILFEGRPREKFAATSVQERAGWVSAIWDAVLLCQEGKKINSTELCHTEVVKHLAVNTNISTVCLRSEHPLASLDPASDPSMAHIILKKGPERSLPPTPTDAMLPPPSFMRRPLDGIERATPVSPSIYPPTRSVSCTSSLYSQLKSPSITNLGQLSVVKQRLAQIEPNASHRSTPRLASPLPSSRRTHLAATSLAESERMQNALPGLQSTRGQRSGSNDSIIDCYGEAITSLDHDGRRDPLSPPANRSSRFRPAPRGIQSAQVSPLEFSVLFSPTSQHSTTTGRGIQPLVGILQDSSAKHNSQTANLGEQMITTQQVFQNIPRDLVEKYERPILERIHQTLMGVDMRTEENESQLKDMRESLVDLGEKLTRRITSSPGEARGPSAHDLEGILSTLEDMRVVLKSDLPVVFEKLAEIQAGQDQVALDSQIPGMVIGNLKPSFNRDLAASDDPNSFASGGLLSVHTKLDELLAYYSAAAKGVPNTQLISQLKEITDLLKTDSNARLLQIQQQDDSVRYLNELNSWLEAFVKNGTSQIEVAVNGIKQLCREFGCGAELSGVPGTYSDPNGQENSILGDVRHLLVETKARDRSAALLQASVDGLAAVINDDLQKDAGFRNTFTPAFVIDLIDRQRQNQESLLSALTAELSNEIRGERLRFVEAMKEATAINVQVHVEQFKKELTREVLGVTQEVGRLHKERQVMENQIADLFAFYSKQKQTGAPLHSVAQDQYQGQT